MNLKLRTIPLHFALMVLCISALFPVSCASTSRTTTPGVTDQALRVSKTNPRYFQDSAGQVVYLTGSHNWGNLQDEAPVGQPLRNFDYNSYLDFLKRHNMNFIRLWSYEGWEFCGSMTEPWYHVPLVYARTGPGTALDGGLKFDVSKFDPAYFDRLRSRVIAAGNAGMYVDIMLFQGWSVCTKRVWQGHPFNAANNINGVDGDLNHDGVGLEVHSLRSPAIKSLQEAYVRKVVHTVNDLDNVLYEISNEGDGCDIEWQNFMVTFLKNYEASKPIQHPVGITYNTCMKESDMYNSPADWISPGGSWHYGDDPPAANAQKVILTDTDHIRSGLGSDWVWKSFTRGLNPIYMDDLTQKPAEESARVAMGQTRTYAKKISLARMTPHGDLTSTSYALAEPGREYLVYNPSGGMFSVNLSDASTADHFSVEWFNPAANIASRGGPVTGGGTRTFIQPFSGAAVLYLLKYAPATSRAANTRSPATDKDAFLFEAALATVVLASLLYFVFFRRLRRAR